MSFTKKIISVAAGVALIAGAGAMAATPAAASKHVKISGKTIISFDKALAPIVAGIEVVAPATKSGTMLGFPVTGADGNGVTHSGGIKIGGIEALNPVIIINTETGGAIINVSVGGNPVPLFNVKNFKAGKPSKKGKATTIVWSGFLHMTDSQAIVDIVNGAIGQPVFTPDQGLGKIRTTIIETKK